MTDEERRKLVAELRGTSFHPTWYIRGQAADEIERLVKELANANRLLEINHRRSLDKSGGLEIKQSDVEPSLSDQMYGFHGAGFNSTTSDAEPLAKHPLGPDNKPMVDWYYDDDGVCRPSRAADRSGK